MNLIQQLQTTPKWKEFEEWYYPRYINNHEHKRACDLTFYLQINQHPDFLKGVFEKFITETCNTKYQITVEGWIYEHMYIIWNQETQSLLSFNSLEELLIWYFNN